jgi:hypothetical protein
MLPEAERLLNVLKTWRRELLTFYRTRITNARTAAANLNAGTFRRAEGDTATTTTTVPSS